MTRHLTGATLVGILLFRSPPAAVDCALRSFVVRNAYRVATPLDVLDAIGDRFPDAREKLSARGANF